MPRKERLEIPSFERRISLSNIKLVAFDRSLHALPDRYLIYLNMSRFGKKTDF